MVYVKWNWRRMIWVLRNQFEGLGSLLLALSPSKSLNIPFKATLYLTKMVWLSTVVLDPLQCLDLWVSNYFWFYCRNINSLKISSGGCPYKKNLWAPLLLLPFSHFLFFSINECKQMKLIFIFSFLFSVIRSHYKHWDLKVHFSFLYSPLGIFSEPHSRLV